MNEEKIERGKQIVEELSGILRELPDSEVLELLGTGAMADLLKAILDPSEVKKYPNIAEFLLANKIRASLLAYMRYAITQNYSFKGTKEGRERFVSPDFHQWFEDGVMFLEGKERFTGFIGLYRNKELKFAIAARDVRGGEQMGPDDFEFLSIEDFNKCLKTIPPNQITDLEKPVRELKELLNRKETDESKYQELIQKYPWILGLQFEAVQDHRKLDDENIPDFTGVRRVHDKERDIIEIKQPFIQIFRRDGNFASEFNDAWNQVERYLNFAREEKDYLRRKGLRFNNPKCYLFIGFEIPDDGLKKIKNKEKLNPAIEIRTYKDLLAYVESTIEFVKNLKSMNKKDVDAR
jgi:hypothetical protein